MLRMGREFLARKRIDEPRLEAELLVAHALGCDRLRLFLDLERPLSTEEVERARALFARRARREPTAYLTGRREFYGRAFDVGPAVLIPRPETELLVDRARDFARERALVAPRVLDVGTGSGAIAITLALELERERKSRSVDGQAARSAEADGTPETAAPRVVACDVSKPALEVARANAARLCAGSRAELEFVAGDGALAARARAPFDLVVSNPPYIDPAVRATLAPEVRDHEPALALFAPAGDPHHWVKRLIAEAAELVAPGGALFVELGHDQREAALAAAHGREARVHLDLARLPRVLEVRF